MKILLLLFLICSLDVKPATDVEFNLTGTVHCSEDKTPVPGCTVILKGSNGSLIMTKTDLQGSYLFKLKHATTYDVYTITDKTVTTPTARFGFLASDDHGLFSTIDLTESQNFQKDFELTKVSCCGYRLPLILFKKNSCDLDSAGTCRSAYDSTVTKVDIVFMEFVTILNKNPTIIIELSAHASGNEKNQDALSLFRAEFIRQELIKRGVDDKRIVTKGWGSHKRKICDQTIAKEPTKEGKEILHAINRRCVMKIISWDYIVPVCSDQQPLIHPATPEFSAPAKRNAKALPETKTQTASF